MQTWHVSVIYREYCSLISRDLKEMNHDYFGSLPGAMHSAQQQALHQGCVKVFVIYKGTLLLHRLFLTGHDILFSNLDITRDKDQLLCCFSSMLLAPTCKSIQLECSQDCRRVWPQHLDGPYGQAPGHPRGLQRASKMLKAERLFQGGTSRVDTCLMIITCPTNTNQSYTRLLGNASHSPQCTNLT